MKEKIPVVELQHIDTIYEGERIPVIKDISLTVEPGEFIAIIGPNGAGKTTLLETINGLLTYSSGVGYVFGKDILKAKSSIRKHIGFVIQNYELDALAPFLCKDIVMSGRAGIIGPLRFPGRADWDVVWQCMGLVGMIDFAHRPIGKLSGGEFQKILIARALAQQPEILLLDEPFSNLDVSARGHIEILLNRIHEQDGTTIIIVSHDLSFIPQRCNRIIVMKNGSILKDDEKNKILDDSLLNDLFYCRGERG